MAWKGAERGAVTGKAPALLFRATTALLNSLCNLMGCALWKPAAQRYLFLLLLLHFFFP